MTNMTDLRRLFRNRFELLAEYCDRSGANTIDGSNLTLRDLCAMLSADPELFPLHYDSDIKRLCEHQFRYWLRGRRSYADVTRLVLAYLDAVEGLTTPQSGIWLPALLNRQFGSSTAPVSHPV